MVSKKEQVEYFKKILNKGLSDSLVNERKQDYEELMELFKKHPDYPSKLEGVIDIKIIKNKRNAKYYEFNLIRENGLIEDISYRCCINTRNSNHDFLNAMRNCINPQIQDFKRLAKKECEFCKDTNNIHIDHIYMFKYLMSDFLIDRTDIPTKFDDNIDNSAIFKKEDIEFSNEWYLYHATHATLRPLCAKCNLSRNKTHYIIT